MKQRSRTLVQTVLRTASVPETVVQEIVTQAVGNPFFLEELAWNAIEHGGELPAPLAVPETIEAVLAAYRATGATSDRPERLALLAEASIQGGQTTEESETLAMLDQSEVRLWEAELNRVRGELLLQPTTAQPEEAEVCF